MASDRFIRWEDRQRATDANVRYWQKRNRREDRQAERRYRRALAMQRVRGWFAR